MKILVLNGVNLGRLGSREPAIYGGASHDDLRKLCISTGADLGYEVEVRQTDVEAEFIGWLHSASDDWSIDGVVLNPAAWTHTSVAVRDAVAGLTAPIVEVHLSNPLAREEFRHTSLTAGLALGVVAGFGVESYRLAIDALSRYLTAKTLEGDSSPDS